MRNAAEVYERSAEYFRLSAIQPYPFRESLIELACKLWENAIDLDAVERQRLIPERGEALN